MGVVFGDIGTSPLYALRATVLATEGGLPNHIAVMGSLSMIFWALILVVTVKYVLIIMRADNNGEGGTLALAALAHRSPGMTRRIKATIGIGAIVGLALFFGDGMLTPAITVLSAVEGLTVENNGFAPLVVPLALVILVGLFLMQSRGTHKIGRLFGPVMVLWFVVLAGFGAVSLVKTPGILAAVNPWYALLMFLHAPWVAFVSAGRGGAGGDRLRGAVCRHGPFRPPAHPVCLAVRRPARPDAELFRPGRGPAAQSRTGRYRILLRHTALGAYADGGCWRPWPPSSPRRR